jgi:hypothetical protein
VRVKTLLNLQPTETPAHCVIIKDDTGTPIFVALQLDDRITYAEIGSPDFYALLKAVGEETNVRVVDIEPKPIQQMLRKG